MKFLDVKRRIIIIFTIAARLPRRRDADKQQRAGFYARRKFLQVIHLRNCRNGRKSKDFSLQIKHGAALRDAR